MSRDHRIATVADVAIDHVQIGAADAARAHPNQQLIRTRLGLGDVLKSERPPGPIEHHRAHADSMDTAGKKQFTSAADSALMTQNRRT